jgi:lipoprotein-anchoring transpeptidase ErfK/SrfK
MRAGVDDTSAGWAARPSAPLRLAVLSASVVLGGAWSAAAVAAPAVPATQELVTLFAAHPVRSAPHLNAAVIVSVEARRPITGVRTVVPLLGRAPGGWLRVRLPGRPNGSTGWIRRQGTTVALTTWHIVVDTARRRVVVFRSGKIVKIVRAVVGKPSTPTPAGTFFVEEAVRLLPGDAGAPFALALSARSDVLQEFDGGPGQIALHGLANVGGTLGTAVSHGCVRLDTDAIRWLVGRIGAGVPVTVTG